MPVTWYTSAPYAFPEGVQRFSWLGFSGTPSAMFDGYDAVVGGMPAGSMYSSYAPIVAAHLAADSPLAMSAQYALLGTTGMINVHIEVTAAVTTTSNQVHFVIVEDQAHSQVNLARRKLANESFLLTQPGQSVDIAREFTLEAGWDPDRIGIVVFVQSHAGNKAVLQAAKAVPNYAATVVIDAEPDGLDAGWHLSGPYGLSLSGSGDKTLPVFAAGEHTLAWQQVAGWTTPSPATQTLDAPVGGTITFAGLYTGGAFAAVTAGPLGAAGAGRGVSLIDADGDGDLDIYVVNHLQSNRLLRNDGGGLFTDIAAGALADAGPAGGAAWADYDNDGDMDLYLARDGQANLLLRNDGGVFSDATTTTIADAGPGRAVCWADFNNDGLVDLYLVNHDAPNRLYRSYGDPGIGQWFFFEVGGAAGDAGPGAGAAWADYDNDGDLDLFIANSYGANRLLQNNGDYGFWDVTVGLLGDTGNAMGAAWGDYDNDGDLDLYVANDGQADLLLRNGDGGFSLVAGGALGDAGRGRGAAWGDYDNDGDLDLYVARHGQPDLLLRNDGGDLFTRVPLGVPEASGQGNSAAWGDLDGDGDLDVYLVNDGGPSALLRNDGAGGGHWLRIRLRGVTANAAAIGARVRVVAGGRAQLRELAAGSGFRAQNDPTAHFGLGAATRADTVQVIWPGGGVQTFARLAADQVVEIVQAPQTGVPDGPAGAAPAALRLLAPHPNPFNPATVVRFELPAPVEVELCVHALDGRRVRTLARGRREAGVHAASWDGRDESGRPAASGVYVVRLRAGQEQTSRRLVLLK